MLQQLRLLLRSGNRDHDISLAAERYVEQATVLLVPLVVLHQHSQQSRDQPPAHFQALQHHTTTDVAPQHDRKLPLQILRVPRHANPRRHVVHVLQPLLTLTLVVVQQLHCRPFDLQHRRGKNQVAIVISCIALDLVLGRRGSELLGSVEILTRSSKGVHAISLTICFQEAHALSKAGHVLRERDHVAPELGEARPTNSDITHLHVLQRDQHRFCGRGHLEQLHVLGRKPKIRIHHVQRGKLGNH